MDLVKILTMIMMMFIEAKESGSLPMTAANLEASGPPS